MTPLDVVAYGASAIILLTYAYLGKTGRLRPMHWANALGSIPIGATEIIGHVWPPLILTGSFGILGVVGLLNGDR